MVSGLSFFFFLISISAVFAAGKNWTLVDYEIALRGIDRSIQGEPWCQLKPDEARHLLLPLRPLWEETLKKTRKRMSLAALRTQAKKCSKNCTCDLWALVLDEKPGSFPEERALLRAKTKSESRNKNDVCLRARQDLCRTLLPELRASADRDYRSESNF